MGSFLERKPLAEARDLLLSKLEAVETESLETSLASGRVTARAVFAEHPAPHYRASAMDGIAVRAADTWAATEQPVRLTVHEDEATPGTDAVCQPIDTGGLLPDWADAVIRIEETRTVEAPQSPGSPAAPGAPGAPGGGAWFRSGA